MLTDLLPAYTQYAFFEWSLIFLDVIYDGVSEIDFREANLQVAQQVPV
jgi:hypothetical protein